MGPCQLVCTVCRGSSSLHNQCGRCSRCVTSVLPCCPRRWTDATSDPCTWTGVLCENGAVTQL